MNSDRYRRGNERPDHRDCKGAGCLLLLQAGCDMATCELHGADVVGYYKVGQRIHVIAIEFERTPRNIIRNIRRDLAHLVDLVVTACMTPEVTGAAVRLVQRQLTSAELDCVRVVHVSSLTESYLRDLMAIDSGSMRVGSSASREEERQSSEISACTPPGAVQIPQPYHSLAQNVQCEDGACRYWVAQQGGYLRLCDTVRNHLPSSTAAARRDSLGDLPGPPEPHSLATPICRLAEAAFAAGGAFARAADILNPGEDSRWGVIEVKSTASMDYPLIDVSLRRHCYEAMDNLSAVSRPVQIFPFDQP